MNKLLVTLASIIALVVGAFFVPQSVTAALLAFIVTVAAITLIRSFHYESNIEAFLTNIFLAGLLVRIVLAALIYGLELQDKMGPDATYYDYIGSKIADYWWGVGYFPNVNMSTSGWGMHYFVGLTYFIADQNPLAGQFIIAVLGALTSVVGFVCAKDIFQNVRVAKYSATFIAFFPSMIIWTSQLLKDGLIIFFLVLTFLAAMRLQKKFDYLWVLLLLFSLFGLFSLRFYVFFIAFGAVIGGFILSKNSEGSNLAKRFIACAVIGVAFAYAGVFNISQEQTERYINLQQIQNSRQFAAEAANSGFAEDLDVTTTGGVLTAIPIGLVTLFLAPFPWQVTNITQLLTMPEMIIWWLSLPFIFTGIMYSVKNRFRESLAILFFALVLSLSYSIYQGNIGTLYRQRAQIQVFLLIFAAVGVVVKVEQRENKKLVLNKKKFHPRISSYK